MPLDQTDVQILQGALNQIDTATTQCGVAQTAIASRIQGFLDKIAAAAGDEAAVRTLAGQATAEVAKFQPIADALTALGTDPGNPVPVPVPVDNPPTNQP